MRPECELSGPPNTRFFGIRVLAETGSTNADVLEAASEGADEGFVVVAEHQSAGRGRQGRPWLDSPRSSLLFSFLLRPNTEHLTLLPLLSGLAVAEALKELCNVDVGLKWPNDVLSKPSPSSSESPIETVHSSTGERKLVGILAEANTRQGKTAVVVGIGTNLEFFDGVPQEIADVATDLASLVDGPVPDRLDLLNVLLIKIEGLLRILETGGQRHILSRYREACITLGREVRMETPTGNISGRAVDIASDGGLVIETSEGLKTVTAGDTHHIGGWGSRTTA